MSERDLPSKVEFTDPASNMSHHNVPPGHPLHSRIHSSKSVPSLNSDQPHPHSSTTVPPPMVRSPGHPGSISMSHHGHMDNGPRYPPQHYPSASMTMQPASKSGGHQNSHIMPGHNGIMDHLHNQHLRSRSIQSLTDPPYRPDIGNKQPSTPTLHAQAEEPERFYQNVGFYPPPPPPPSNPANMPVRTYIPYSSSTGNISSSAAGGFRSPTGSHTSANQYPPVAGGSGYPHQPGPPRQQAPPNLNTSMPGNLNWTRPNPAGHHQNPPPTHGVNRDLLRQEAKMLEMQDELRRREERAAIMMSKAQQQNYPPKFSGSGQQQQPISSNNNNGRVAYPPGQQRPLSGVGPPAAPKPYRPGDLQLSSSSEIAPGRPPHPDEYRHQTQFSASMGEIPKGAFSYNNGMIPAKSAPVPANPWDREAKEIEAGRKKEAAKHWRDQQIYELDILPHKTSSQEEQLRALKLEREFQRRAEEMRKDDDGENYEDEDDDQNERKAMIRRLQEDLERTRISSSNGNGGMKLDPMEEERSRKIEEMRRKKLELEAAQAAEERLVREAAKRRVSLILCCLRFHLKTSCDISITTFAWVLIVGRRA
jgi:afadin